jgi:hypothetical protein
VIKFYNQKNFFRNINFLNKKMDLLNNAIDSQDVNQLILKESQWIVDKTPLMIWLRCLFTHSKDFDFNKNFSIRNCNNFFNALINIHNKIMAILATKSINFVKINVMVPLYLKREYFDVKQNSCKKHDMIKFFKTLYEYRLFYNMDDFLPFNIEGVPPNTCCTVMVLNMADCIFDIKKLKMSLPMSADGEIINTNCFKLGDISIFQYWPSPNDF